MEIIVDLFNQHSGDIDELKRMALESHLAGADWVKLQLFNSKVVWGDDSRKTLELNYKQTEEIFNYCRSMGIKIFATPFDEERLEWLTDLGVERYKIASRTVRDDTNLCDKILGRNKLTLVSTGLNNVNDFIFGHDPNIKYLFCVAEYPTFLFNKKLKDMPRVFSCGGYEGFSDHVIGFAASLKAYFNGATIIEKHFTNNLNAQNEIEKAHLCSFTPETLRQFKNIIRELEIINHE